MHFAVTVILDGPEDKDGLRDALEAALRPFQEVYDEETQKYSGEWDWWRTGGRWTGMWSGYDPAKDPRNRRPCGHCSGTGVLAPGGDGKACNICRGGRTMLMWSGDWAEHDGDIMEVERVLTTGKATFAVIVDGEFVRTKESGEGDISYADILGPHRGRTAVLVDCHG